jgi:dolichol kinase
VSGAAPSESRRRALHLATGSIGIAAFFLPHHVITIIVLTLAGTALALEAARRMVPAINRAVTAATMGAMRPEESHGLMNGTLLAMGYAVSWLVFPAPCAAAGIIVAATADPAAAMVGTRVARARGRKTIAGSAAAFVVALVVLLLARMGTAAAAAGAIAAALTERLPARAGFDNLAVPVVTAAVLWAIA